MLGISIWAVFFTGTDSILSTHYANPGNITIGSASVKAGDVRIGYIYTYAGDTNTYVAGTGGSGGAVTIVSSGDVLIEDDNGAAGDIRTFACRQGSSGGPVSITHQGRLVAGTIDTRLPGGASNGSKAGDVTLNGGDASDNLSVNAIMATRYQNNTYVNTSARQQVTISNYKNVTIGSINTSTSAGSDGITRRLAGHVVITSGISGNIEIPGEINLKAGYFDGVNNDNGLLSLSAGGEVTLGPLDLSKMLYAQINSGGKKSYITGVLANFGATGSGDGTLASPILASQTALRAADDQVIYYDPAVNLSLAGKVYRVADLTGTAATGGLLVPQQAAGTLVIFR